MDARRPTRAANEGTRKSMRSNKGRDTRPELAIRRRVHAAGLRYRVSVRPLAGFRRTADLVFSRIKVAVFVDGCFWHGCPEHHTKAATNAGYWAEKVRVNRARDADTNARLNEEGWRVVRVWEHEDPDAAAARVIAEVRAVREARAAPGGVRPLRRSVQDGASQGGGKPS